MVRKTLLSLALVLAFIPFLGEFGREQPVAQQPTSPPLAPTFTPTTPSPVATRAAAPRVLSRDPAGLDLDTRRPIIAIQFDRPMDQASVAAALRIEPPLPVDLHWQENTLILEPRIILTSGTGYQFTILATATAVDGVPLVTAHYWSYFIPYTLQNFSAPSDYDRAQPISLFFGYTMDTQTVEQSIHFDPPLDGEWMWDDLKRTATFRPAALLPPDTEFTLFFAGTLRNHHGEELDTPQPQTFITPSPIVRFTPTDTGSAHPASLISFAFDRPMNQATVEAAFQISPTVAGDLSWQANTLLFAPAEPLAEYTNYTVTLADTVTSSDGEPVLRRPYARSFSTGEWTAPIFFGYGSNAQVLDADGRRAVQYQINIPGNSRIQSEFRLYQLSFDHFLAHYAGAFQGGGEWNRTPISTTETPLAANWSVEHQLIGSDYAYVRETLIPADIPPGLYLLEVENGESDGQLLLILTRQVIVVKQVEGQLVTWVTEINGEPVAAATVGVYARDGVRLVEGQADSDGILRSAISMESPPLLVVAQTGDDLTVAGLSNEWRSRNAHWWGQPERSATHFAAYIYTDRPIYRPGQTVHFKAIVRHDEDAIISLPEAGRPVTVRIRDARNNVVQTHALVTNDFGTLHGNFQLAEGAMLGDYAVELAIDGEPHRQVFKVQDYRKPDYKVTVSANADRYLQGETITVQVDSRYFYDEPVMNGRVSVRRFQLWPREWWMDEATTPDYTWIDHGSLPVEGVTDAAGRFTFTLDATVEGAGQPVDWQSSLRRATWGVEVTVDDGSRQTVSGFAVVQVYDAAEQLRLDVGGYAKTPGEPFTVAVEATTLEGEPVGERTLELLLKRYWSGEQNEDRERTFTLVTASDGRALLPLTLDAPGYYELTVRGLDLAKRPISYQGYLYVFGDELRGWYIQNQSNLRIAADRASYAPGESARLLIESTMSGPALLTFERGATRRQQLVRLTAPLTTVDVPLQPDDAPNIFVTVHAWQPQDTTLSGQDWASKSDSALYHASVELQVPVTGKRLILTIKPDRADYAPRDEATFILQVRNEAGQPLPAGSRAELSLALVDEAIFSLSEELAGPIFDAFYAKRENLVRTYDGLAPMRWFGGGGGGGGGAPLADPRSDFPDTAVWIPVIETGENGQATVTITLPDSLTSWRLTAKATTGVETQVGESFVNIVTKQPLVIRPLLPRHLTSGDQVALSAMVHNDSDQPLDITVSVVVSATEGSGSLQITTPITQTIHVDPGAAQVVGWPVRAEAAGEAQLTFIATADELADAVRLPLSIQPLAVPAFSSQIGDFSGALTTVITLPAESLDASSVVIDLNRSIADSLLTGLDYLTGFPYGCVEQTMSRALPNAVVGRALAQLGVNDPGLQADLPALINAGLQRLYGFQHSDGGWGWWYDDASDAYQTAWVLFGLAVTREAGHEVDPAVIQRGADWLKQQLGAMDIRTRAYALYSMAVAGHGDLPATRTLFARVDELDAFSQAALALALYSLGVDEKAEQIVDQLAAQATTMDGMVYWRTPVEDGYYHQKTMASTTRTTALVLSALVRIRPGHELEPGIVRWLMSQRRSTGWGTTNETSYAILALTDHLLAAAEAGAPATYQVELNGAIIAEGELGAKETSLRLEIPASDLYIGANTLQFTHSGGGWLYYTINNRTYLAQAAIEATGALRVTRQYLDAGNNQPIETASPGQLIKVQLTVQTDDNRFYMIVEDQLPGGLEALNESLNTTSHIALAYGQEPPYFWQEYGYNYKEVHGNRVSFFITELPSGTRTFTYLARATQAGEFVALPAEAYAMYDLAAWGRSASTQLVVGE
jgi:uncharacterized protein YfaS (alpha-2-macroglobulin family)